MIASRRFFHSATHQAFEKGQEVPEDVAKDIPSEWLEESDEEVTSLDPKKPADTVTDKKVAPPKVDKKGK